MAFRMALSPSYRVMVNVQTPNSAGSMDHSSFNVEFTRMSTDEVDALRKLPQRDAMRRVLVGWDGLLDEGNSAVPFGEQTREALLAIPHALLALVEAYWDSVYKAREKN